MCVCERAAHQHDLPVADDDVHRKASHPLETPALEVRDLHKTFGGVPVPLGVGFSVLPGRVTGLAGENGAGKSTLMKIVSGQYRQDAGQVVVRGQELLRADPIHARALGVGIVPQELAPYPDREL